jgi:hypothetical protein
MLEPTDFPFEATLHDLVESSAEMLPLSGDPYITVLGREVSLGTGFADLIAIEADGRIVIIETKLKKNAEARRAVVAQVLTYAAYLRGLSREDLERVLRPHLEKNGFSSVRDAVEQSMDSGGFEDEVFIQGLEESLASGSFRLVVVLDEAPDELIALAGYLEGVTQGISIDLITVSPYRVGGEEVLVPVRVDPDHEATGASASQPSGSAKPKSATTARVAGSERWEQGISRAGAGDQPKLRRLLDWARSLESRGLAELHTQVGIGRDVLLVWIPGGRAGLVSIWNDHGAYVSLWRSVFVRRAWNSIETVERLTGKSIGQGSTLPEPSAEVLDVLSAAYEEAARSEEEWNGRDYYVSFGENEQRIWAEAREFGFVSAGGGSWYTNTLRQLGPDDRVFVYIPKKSGVGGYVGVGVVTGGPRMAEDFMVRADEKELPYLNVTSAPEAGQYRGDEEMAEWVVPVRWIATREGDDAVKSPDLFSNQNSAAKLRHGYTLKVLSREFGLDE